MVSCFASPSRQRRRGRNRTPFASQDTHHPKSDGHDPTGMKVVSAAPPPAATSGRGDFAPYRPADCRRRRRTEGRTLALAISAAPPSASPSRAAGQRRGGRRQVWSCTRSASREPTYRPTADPSAARRDAEGRRCSSHTTPSPPSPPRRSRAAVVCGKGAEEQRHLGQSFRLVLLTRKTRCSR